LNQRFQKQNQCQKHIKLAKKKKHKNTTFLGQNGLDKKKRTRRTFNPKPNNVNPNPDQIRSNQGHKYVGNYAMIDN
jgi:hypothetical protein